MKLDQSYDGKHFPAYLYEPPMLMVVLTSRTEPEDTKNTTWLYLPQPRHKWSGQWPVPASMIRKICDSDLLSVCSLMR